MGFGVGCCFDVGVCISFGFGLFNNVGSWVSCCVTLGCGLVVSLVLVVWWCIGLVVYCYLGIVVFVGACWFGL